MHHNSERNRDVHKSFCPQNSGRQPQSRGQGSNVGKLWKFCRRILKTPHFSPSPSLKGLETQILWTDNFVQRPSCRGPSSTRQRQDMNIGKFCPLPLCTLIGNFRIYLYIVSLVVILSNWVCDNWIYRFPICGRLDIASKQTFRRVTLQRQRITNSYESGWAMHWAKFGKHCWASSSFVCAAQPAQLSGISKPVVLGTRGLCHV